MTGSGPPRADNSAAVQADVARLRAGLLAGRGPGAGGREIERNTRERSELAGRPTAQHLEAVARQAASSSGDPAAIASDIVALRDDLAVGASALRTQIRARWARTRRIACYGLLAGAVLTVLRRRA